MLIRPLLGRMMVLGSAITVGALFAPATPTFLGVDDGSCRSFAGSSTGNDPSQVVLLELCRDGREVTGVKRSHGDAGHSVFHLQGRVDARGVATLEIDEVQQVSTSTGWKTCTDDLYRFMWDPADGALIGRFDSAECADHALMRLHPLDTDVSNPNHCGMYRH